MMFTIQIPIEGKIIKIDKFKYWIVKIFFPSFDYNFSSSLPGRSYTEKVVSKLKAEGMIFTIIEQNKIKFFINTGKVLRGFSFSKLLVSIEKKNEKGYLFKVQFNTLKAINYFFTFLISLLIIIRIVLTGEIIGILIVPMIFFSGHILFLGTLPSKANRIKQFLLKLDD